jgi:hypothetical protein
MVKIHSRHGAPYRAATTKRADKDKDKTEPFTLWCLRNIDVDTIKTVSGLLYAAHFKSLLALKVNELRKLAEAFQTSKWIIYFVLDEHTIEQSIKFLCHISRFKHTRADQKFKLYYKAVVELCCRSRRTGIAGLAWSKPHQIVLSRRLS